MSTNTLVSGGSVMMFETVAHRVLESRRRWWLTSISLGQDQVLALLSSNNVIGHDRELERSFRPKVLTIDEYWCAKSYDWAISIILAHTVERVVHAGDIF